jgi:predicted Zn-dependent protease
VSLTKALAALQEAVGNDDSSEALTLFGRALLLTNDADAAERMLQDATEKKPVDPLAFSYLADAAERLDHPAVARQALLDYEALRGDEPDDRRKIAFATRLGDLSSRMQDMPAAAAYFLRAAQGSDPALLARAADAQLRAGNVDAAWDTASKAMEKDPANALALSVQRRIARGRS